MPSQMRRSAVILAYLVGCFVLFSVAMATLAPAGLVSRQCIDGNPCSAAELVILGLLWVAWAGISIWAAVLGWRGQLWGARAQR